MLTVFAKPDALGGASDGLMFIRSGMPRRASRCGPNDAVVPASPDPLALITVNHFVSHANLFQQISEQAAAVRQQLAATLGRDSSYATTEAANAAAVG